MYPLLRQVQLARIGSKGPARRLAGIEPPKFGTAQTTFTGLQARLDRDHRVLQGLKSRSSTARGRTIRWQMRTGPRVFTARLPWPRRSFYFHVRHRLRHPAPAAASEESARRDFLRN